MSSKPDRTDRLAELHRLLGLLDYEAIRAILTSEPELMGVPIDGRTGLPFDVSKSRLVVKTSWIERMAERGTNPVDMDVVRAGFEAGARADDAMLFPGMPLLCMRGWWTPAPLALGLAYGADPDSAYPLSHYNKRVAGKTLGQELLHSLVAHSEGLSGDSEAETIESLRLLLAAGAKVVVPSARQTINAVNSASWLLGRAASIHTVAPDKVLDVAAQCITLLAKNGDDIHSRQSTRQTTPIVEAIRGRSRRMFDAYADAGVALDAPELELEMQEAFGDEGRTYLTEARMRRVIETASATPEHAATGRRPRL